MAGMYGELKNYQAAVDNYKIARSIDSIYFKDYSLSYSINLAGLGKFEEALAAVNDFKVIPNLQRIFPESCGLPEQEPTSLQSTTPQKKIFLHYKFEPQNMGDSINSCCFRIFSHHQSGWKTSGIYPAGEWYQ